MMVPKQAQFVEKKSRFKKHTARQASSLATVTVVMQTISQPRHVCHVQAPGTVLPRARIMDAMAHVLMNTADHNLVAALTNWSRMNSGSLKTSRMCPR